MEQGLRLRVLLAPPARVWGEAWVEAGWVDRLQRGQAEIVSVQTAERRLLMLPDSLVAQEAVLNVVRK